MFSFPVRTAHRVTRGITSTTGNGRHPDGKAHAVPRTYGDIRVGSQPTRQTPAMRPRLAWAVPNTTSLVGMRDARGAGTCALESIRYESQTSALRAATAGAAFETTSGRQVFP